MSSTVADARMRDAMERIQWITSRFSDELLADYGDVDPEGWALVAQRLAQTPVTVPAAVLAELVQATLQALDDSRAMLRRGDLDDDGTVGPVLGRWRQAVRDAQSALQGLR